jgi:hypothetical protein
MIQTVAKIKWIREYMASIAEEKRKETGFYYFPRQNMS